jgi:hypothetical protein
VKLARTLVLLLCVFLAACAGVLGFKPRAPGHPFEHAAHVNGGVSCVSCHEGITRAGDEGPLHLPDTARCQSCHEKPHDPRPCEGCHGEAHRREEASLARKHLRFAHAEHLRGTGGQCVPCHAEPTRPPMAQCFGCHEHKDQWKTRECDGCHADLPAELSKPASHVFHEGDFVREHGVRAAASKDLCATCHTEAQCASCHGVTAPVLPWKLAFDRPSLTGLHRAGFLARHPDESRANPGLCSTCHDSERFCQDCHLKKKVAGFGFATPHPPNWVRARGGEHGRAARLDPQSCASCHSGAGEALCVGCHKVGGPGGSPHGRGFVSTLSPERDRPCRQCHTR